MQKMPSFCNDHRGGVVVGVVRKERIMERVTTSMC